MAFDDEPVKAEVHGLLAQRRDKFAASAYVARVADYGKIGNAAVKLDRNMPHRQVAVKFLVISGETAVNGCYALYSRSVYALNGRDLPGF